MHDAASIHLRSRLCMDEVPRNVMHDANCPGRIPTGAETVCNCLTEGSIGAMLFLGSECYAELTYQNIK